MLQMKLIVAGSRKWPSVKVVFDALDILLSETDLDTVTIISGHCPNTDRYTLDSPDMIGEVYAKVKGIDLETYPANWRPNGVYDNQAGMKRNATMAKLATHLAAFWDSNSSGTKNMINQAKSNGLVVAIITKEGKIKRCN